MTKTAPVSVTSDHIRNNTRMYNNFLLSHHDKKEVVDNYMKEIELCLDKVNILTDELKKKPEELNLQKNILRQFQIIQVITDLLSDCVRQR